LPRSRFTRWKRIAGIFEGGTKSPMPRVSLEFFGIYGCDCLARSYLNIEYSQVILCNHISNAALAGGGLFRFFLIFFLHFFAGFRLSLCLRPVT
jgi:hypothetical protein